MQSSSPFTHKSFVSLENLPEIRVTFYYRKFSVVSTQADVHVIQTDFNWASPEVKSS